MTDFSSGAPADATRRAIDDAHADPAALQSATRKVSRNLLWFLFVLFFFSFLDRINIGFAGLTMRSDLGLTMEQFGFATTLFYVAYIACGIPGNVALARIGARQWVGWIMIAWGLASTATLFATGPRTLYVLRILVGITEAGFLPGVLLYMTHWFPAATRARATALFMIAMPVTAMVGSLLSGYILHLDGAWGFRGWQWLFLLEGFPATLLGLVVFARLRNSPLEARWLTPAEKQALMAVLDAEHRAADTHGARTSLRKELCSPAVILYALTYFFLVNTLAMIAIWTPLIVKAISRPGESNIVIGMLAAIPQLFTIVMMVAAGHSSDRSQERKWHLFGPMAAAAAGWFLVAYIHDPIVQMAGVCLAAGGSYTAMAIFWTTPDHVLSRRARAVGIAVINAFGNISSALNPLVVGWLHDLTHNFSAGVVYSGVLMVAAAALALALPIGRKALRHTPALS